MRKTNKIGYFIISHGRPSKQLTYDLFINNGVNPDDVYIICDNLDKTLQGYVDKYNDKIIIFDKNEYIDKCDGGVQKPTGLHSMYPRNAAMT